MSNNSKNETIKIAKDVVTIIASKIWWLW